MVDELPNFYNMTLYSTATTIYFRIMDSIFDGTCADFGNVIIIGLEGYALYLPTGYSVAFINVSFQGYSTDLSSPPSTFHSQQLFDNFILTNTAEPALYTLYSGVTLYFVPNQGRRKMFLIRGAGLLNVLCEVQMCGQSPNWLGGPGACPSGKF